MEAAARPCSVKNAVTVRCEAAFCSSSHAVAGKAAMPIKSAKENIGGTECIRMITHCTISYSRGPYEPASIAHGKA